MPSVFGQKPGGRVGQRSSLRDLTVQAAELERFRQLSGARDIPQDRPGFFRTVVDLLSRVEYAEAGALEEFVQGVDKDGVDPGDFLVAASRAGRELFSGVGSLQGEKRGFSEALEKLGVGDLGRLSDIIPALEGTWGDVSGRGALGFVLGVAGDPLTYTGLGSVTKVGGNLGRLGGRVVAGAGENVAKDLATRAGLKFAQREATKILPRQGGKLLLEGAESVVKEGDDLLRSKALDDILGRVEGAFKTTQQKARTVDAIRRGRMTSLSEADQRVLAYALAGERRKVAEAAGERFFAKDLDSAMRELVDHEVRTMVRSGVSASDEIAGDLLLIAQNQAEKRLIEAAKYTPGLLKGGRGITFLGRDIPGTDKLTALLGSGLSSRAAQVVHRLEKSDSGLATAVADGAMGMKKTLDAFGSLFSRDFKTRNVPGFNMLKQAALDAHGAINAKLLSELQDSAIARLARKEDVWKRVTTAVDEGTIASLEGVEREAAEAMKKLNDQMLLDEVKAGLLRPEQVVENYVSHFYHNPTDELVQTVQAWKPQASQLASLGRHGEERAFRTLREAVETSANYAKTHKNVAPLRPVYDPVEIMRRRILAHADGMSHQAYFEAVGREFGVEKLQDIGRDAALRWITPTAGVSAKEFAHVEKLVARGKTSTDEVRALSNAARSEFMRQRLSRVTSKRELDSVLRKYAEFFDNLPQGGSLLGQIAEDGSRFVTTTQKGLTQYEIPKTIADDIQGMASRVLNSKDMNRLLKGYTRVNNFFKRMVTIYFPSFHFRNAYSNVAQSFLDIGIHALDPRLHKHSVSILGKAKGALTDDLGRELYDYDTIRTFIRQFGVRTSTRKITEQTGEGTAREIVKGVKGVGGKVRQAGAAIENEARVALFVQHLRRGLSPQEAAARVKKFLFDYENLSGFEQGLRHVIPFYVWTRKNLELQVRTLLTNPGREANLVRAFRGRESENDQMISWEGEALKLRLDRDGNTVRMLTGVDLPIKGLDIIWNGGVRRTLQQNLGMITPLVKGAFELGTGSNLFTGRDMTRQQSGAIGRVVEHMPAPIKDWMGWRKDRDPVTGKVNYSFDGERFYLLFQSYAFSRFVSTSDRAFRETLNDGNWAAFLLDITTGIRAKNLNMTEQQMRRLRERIRQTEEVLEKRGFGRKHSIFYDATKSKKRQAVLR